MKVAIDISSVVYGTGVSVYTRNLVRALLSIDKENEYVLFAGTWREKRKIIQFFEELTEKQKNRKTKNNEEDFSRAASQGVRNDRVSLKVFPIPPRLQAKLWNDWHLLSLEKLIGPHDVYHSMDWSLAPTKAKTVITVHDLFFLKRPDLQMHPYRATMERRLKRARDMGLRAIAVSEATKKDLVELLGYPEELITVIYEATEIESRIQNSESRMKEVVDKYKLTKPYLLMVGTREPRKNLERVIEAFRKLESRIRNYESWKLVIAGKVGWGSVEQNIANQGGRVKFLGFVPEDDKFALMKGAAGFLYPSLYEGFGIPILEAFSCGCPVLTSNVSSMPEVAGSGAIYVDPYDLDSIRQGMVKMLNLRPIDRNRLIQNGFKQLKKFSWEKAARETLAIYKSL